MNYITNSRFQPASYLSFKTLKKFTLLVFCFLNLHTSYGQSYPAGFAQVQVANNIAGPTAMAFAPDGRLFITQQTGDLRVVKNGVLLSQPFISLNVNSTGERGLLGIAFDPYFKSNHYIYLYYTLASGANNRVSRFTANGDVVVPGSEHVVLDLDPLSSETNHNGGCLMFGLDERLYIAVGNNHDMTASQNLNTNLGKVLRINKTGTIPSSNPFKTGSKQKRSIWSYGLRNPFTIAVNPVSGKIYANDVGETSWEEINNITSGGHNYGWPTHEGYSSQGGFKSPLYAYAHGTGNSKGCAIAGGTFFRPSGTNFPSKYMDNYFYIDYCNAWINRLVVSSGNATHYVFASNIGGQPVGITTGPDGNLYYLSRADSALYKIRYVAPANSPQQEDLTESESENRNEPGSITGDYSTLVKISPNPAGHYFSVELPETMNESIMRIYNMEGSLMKELNVNTNQQIATDGFINGTYIVMVENTYAVVRKRLIIQK